MFFRRTDEARKTQYIRFCELKQLCCESFFHQDARYNPHRTIVLRVIGVVFCFAGFFGMPCIAALLRILGILSILGISRVSRALVEKGTIQVDTLLCVEDFAGLTVRIFSLYNLSVRTYYYGAAFSSQNYHR